MQIPACWDLECKKAFRAFSSLNWGSRFLGMLKQWGDLFLMAQKVQKNRSNSQFAAEICMNKLKLQKTCNRKAPKVVVPLLDMT